MRRFFKSPPALLVMVLISGCGTRDYESRPATNVSTSSTPKGPGDDSVFSRPKVTEITPSDYVDPADALPTKDSGYLWQLLDLANFPRSVIDKMQSGLRDNPRVSRFEAFGASVVGGGLLGIIIRFSGSSFLGEPPTISAPRWRWKRLGGQAKYTVEGLLRGALATGVCETFLAGGNLTPLRGFLGFNYAAASSATSLALMSMVAASSYFIPNGSKKGGKGGAPKPPSTASGFNGTVSRLGYWLQTSAMGKTIRQTIIPMVVVVGAGFTVYYLVDKHLRGNPIH